MTRKLFGTDGVRGVAGELLSAELALGLARAATCLAEVERPQVLIIRDTRESGEMLQAAVAAGVAAAGGDALLGGVLPTPAAPLLIGRYGFDLAAVLSASHNPYQDNGIKFFGPRRVQAERRDRAADRARAGARWERGRGAGRGAGSAPPSIGRIRELRGAGEDYLRELHTRFVDLDLTGLDVVLDCANGATYEVAPEMFRRLGAERDRHGGRARTGATSTPNAARPTSSGWPSGCSPAGTRSGSRSTGTGIACWRWTATARWSTATS